MEKIPMTRAGHTALETELKHLKSVERPAIIKAIAEASKHDGYRLRTVIEQLVMSELFRKR